MLFHKRTQKTIKVIWMVISAIIIVSMIIAYSGFSMLAQSAPQAAPLVEETAGTPITLDANPDGTVAAPVNSGNAGAEVEPTPSPAPIAPPAQQLDLTLPTE